MTDNQVLNILLGEKKRISLGPKGITTLQLLRNKKILYGWKSLYGLVWSAAYCGRAHLQTQQQPSHTVFHTDTTSLQTDLQDYNA